MPKKKTNLTLEEKIMRAAQAESRAEYRTLSQTVEMLLVEYLAQRQADPARQMARQGTRELPGMPKAA